jgi:pimeloyl-ACP methyl ester carboxylesterase
MITDTSLKAAVALTVDHPTRATSLESTSATTTYHSMTVDGIGIFYREAGPKDASTIVLLHGFPSSSREFDTLIPVLATRYHLIAPDFPGFGQSDAPPPSSYAYTFDNLAKTTNGLLEQLEINKHSFYLHDYGGPVGFRIISAHRSGCRRLSSRMPMPIRKASAPSGPALRNIGPIRKRILKCSMRSCRSQRPNSVTPSAPRIPNVITRTHGLTSTPTCRDPANARSRPISCTTTGRTSRPIRRGKRGCASTSPRFWWSGGGTIPRSSLPVRRRSSAICRMPKSTCSTPAISPWTRRTTRSRVLFLRSLPSHDLTASHRDPIRRQPRSISAHPAPHSSPKPPLASPRVGVPILTLHRARRAATRASRAGVSAHAWPSFVPSPAQLGRLTRPLAMAAYPSIVPRQRSALLQDRRRIAD